MINNSTFSKNRIEVFNNQGGKGGAISVKPIFDKDNMSITIKSSIIKSNSAPNGGFLHAYANVVEENNTNNIIKIEGCEFL